MSDVFEPDRLGAILFAAMPDALIAADKEGVIRVWNEGAERLFGFTPAEAIGQTLDIIIPERLRERHWTGYDETMRTGHTRYGAGDLLAVPATHKNGARLSVEFTILPLHDESGAMAGIAAIMRDVTKRFEEQRALRAELAQLRAGPASAG